MKTLANTANTTLSEKTTTNNDLEDSEDRGIEDSSSRSRGESV
ncbi:MAG: hypothetical protein WA667_01170 [Candidatus Nitrosopolaris sp.]